MHPAPRVDSQAKRCFQRDGTMGQQKNHGLFDFEISKENCGKKNKETIYEVQISQVKDSFIFQFQPVSNKGKLVDSNLPTAYRLTHPDR